MASEEVEPFGLLRTTAGGSGIRSLCLINVSMDPEGLNGVQGTTGGCSGKQRWEYPRLCQAVPEGST